MEVKHLIAAVLAVLVGLALYPAVQQAANAAVALNNSGIEVALLPLIPAIYIIILIAGAAVYVYSKK